jgi:guanylate kinase
MRTFHYYDFDYVVINEELDEAVADVLHIVAAHDCRIEQLDTELLKRITG